MEVKRLRISRIGGLQYIEIFSVVYVVEGAENLLLHSVEAMFALRKIFKILLLTAIQKCSIITKVLKTLIGCSDNTKDGCSDLKNVVIPTKIWVLSSVG